MCVHTRTKFSLIFVYSAAVEYTVSLSNNKLFISGPCLILVFAQVLWHARHTDAKTDVKNYSYIRGQILNEKI